ncbi:unnamed protein product [Calicophoron daubneyi]|uniref:Retinol dehydrogenase 11 n=1 Tax=Calicophoron daubneyi TaxID=300641 RepID=A0AAV2T625_CALDB
MAAAVDHTKEVKGWWNKVCIIQKRLEGKLAIVTGANSGIGAATTAELARRGCKVIMACRNMERAEAAKKEIVTKYGSSNPECVKIDVADDSVIPSLSAVTGDQLIIEQLDLSSLQSVRDFAKRINSTYPKLDFLINNAGATHGQYETTVDGFESTLGTNHLGPFLLTELLLPLLKNAAPSRIIIVSSMGHLMGKLHKPDLQIPKDHYSALSAYNQSKLCNAMHACELSKRLEGSGVVAVSLHPGVVNTRLLDTDNSFTAKVSYALFRPVMVDAWHGAQTTMYTVLTEHLKPGAYYSNCAEASPKGVVHDKSELEWLWNKSCELVGLDANTSI